ncbi:hypothetical protein ZWY2020_056163 [Hordeum vulgare]|nr:hypothetical protein ZWY2020_056163 [Hordeum vulgare]
MMNSHCRPRAITEEAKALKNMDQGIGPGLDQNTASTESHVRSTIRRAKGQAWTGASKKELAFSLIN